VAGTDVVDTGADMADVGTKSGEINKVANEIDKTDIEVNDDDEEDILGDSLNNTKDPILEDRYSNYNIKPNVSINESYGESEKPWEKNKNDKNDKNDKCENDKKVVCKDNKCDNKNENDKNDKNAKSESVVIVADSDDKLIEIINNMMDAKLIKDKNAEEAENADDKEDDKEIKNVDDKEDDKKLIQDCDKPIKEDNNITDPESKKFSSDEESRKNHEGDKRNNDPKLSQKDYDGTGKVKTGKEAPNTGLSSATKE
jgi:hypothetical protein